MSSSRASAKIVGVLVTPVQIQMADLLEALGQKGEVMQIDQDEKTCHGESDVAVQEGNAFRIDNATGLDQGQYVFRDFGGAGAVHRV